MNDKTHLGHRARKRFGQNFLHDPYVIGQIVSAIRPQDGQHLVEIGPGLGALTEPLFEAAGSLTVVELDRDLAARLRTEAQTKWRGKLAVVETDALKYDFGQLVRENGVPMRLVGNLPYNISTPLMFHLVSYAEHILDMHFMLQKEVVERIVAGPGDKHYGRLGVMLQYHCQVEPVLEVGPGAFKPAPKVDSAVVRLVPYGTNSPAGDKPHVAEDEQVLARVVSMGFAQRRKTIRNNYRELLSEQELEQLGLSPSLRPEKLTLADFVAIANYVSQRDIGRDAGRDSEA